MALIENWLVAGRMCWLGEFDRLVRQLVAVLAKEWLSIESTGRMAVIAGVVFDALRQITCLKSECREKLWLHSLVM